MVSLYPESNQTFAVRYLLNSEGVNDINRFVEAVGWVTFNHTEKDVSDCLQLKCAGGLSIYDHTVAIILKFDLSFLVFLGEPFESMHDHVAHKFKFCRVCKDYLRKRYEDTVSISKVSHWSESSPQHSTDKFDLG